MTQLDAFVVEYPFRIFYQPRAYEAFKVAMAHEVFISHSSKDSKEANLLCQKLEQQGIGCWIAPRDILGGTSWPKEISTAVAACKLMVLVFSASAAVSEFVLKEISLAGEYQKLIFPVKIEQVAPTGSFADLFERPERSDAAPPHWLDASTPPLDQHLDQLVSIIQTLLRIKLTPRPRFKSQTSKEMEIFIVSLICGVTEFHFHHFNSGPLVNFFEATVYSIASTLLAVNYCKWLYAAYENLHALGTRKLSISPLWAVASCFIIPFCFYRPLQTIIEIERASGTGNSARLKLIFVFWWLWRLLDIAIWGMAWKHFLTPPITIDSTYAACQPLYMYYVPDLMLSYLVAVIINRRQEDTYKILKTRNRPALSALTSR